MKVFLLIVAFYVYACGLSAQESSTATSSNGWGYGFENFKTDISVWKQSPLVVIDTIGYSEQNRPLYRVSILKDKKIGKQSKRVMFHARTHPSEVQSSYVCKEIISALLSNSDLAKLLLDNCVFNFVPMYNPDGVELGFARKNANQIDIESNWNNPTPEKEVIALREVFKGYMESQVPISIALNLHSASDCNRYFVFHDASGTSSHYADDQRRFISLVRQYFFDGIKDENYFVSWKTSTPTQYPESWFWINHQDKVLALTYEDMNCSSAGDYDKTANALLSGIADYLLTSKTADAYLSLDKPNIIVSPNPIALGMPITLTFPTNYSQNGIVSVIDMNGQLVFEQYIEFSEYANNSITLPINQQGLYSVCFTSSQNQFSTKLLVK